MPPESSQEGTIAGVTRGATGTLLMCVKGWAGAEAAPQCWGILCAVEAREPDDRNRFDDEGGRVGAGDDRCEKSGAPNFLRLGRTHGSPMGFTDACLMGDGTNGVSGDVVVSIVSTHAATVLDVSTNVTNNKDTRYIYFVSTAPSAFSLDMQQGTG